ncbi:exported [Trichoderma arundinaceum]|uniref:Exported n=1 Tax=Trichoderma arundinaceum TaxID=490622 RepID=A0A395P1K3_TRIAR|nr:exported [Trichoderma arundinaceum]
MHFSSLSFALLSAAGIANALPSLGLGDGWLWPLKTPNTVVIDGHRLVEAKLRLKLGDRDLKAALKHLTAQADSWLSQGPWTVTAKANAPPNGTIHDYTSQAPYFWPNPNTADGCPYINKDGVRNPEVDKYQDRVSVGKMFNSTYVLTLAWYYTGNAKYSKHASNILRTWFLDPDTAMNPNLDHAQLIPCANSGRSIGIIDFSQEYTNVIDAVAILNTGAPGWSSADGKAFVGWNKRFLSWLADSPFGIQEATAQNNHGTFANMQIAALAAFTGNHSLAVSRSQLAKSFIDSQITANGSQPQELARTRSFHYSNFDLTAHLRFALIARKVGVDLFKYKGPQGQTLFKAVEFVIPAAAGGAAVWTYPELGFTQYAATDNVRAAAQEGNRLAEKAVAKLVPPPGGDIFALRPAPEQLDSIATVG